MRWLPILLTVGLLMLPGCITEGEFAKAKNQAYNDGVSQGYDDGYSDGYEAGYEDGQEDGYETGFQEAEAKYSQTSGSGPAPSDAASDCDYQEENGDGYGPVLLRYGLVDSEVPQGETVRMWVNAEDCNNLRDMDSEFQHVDDSIDAEFDAEWNCPTFDEGCAPGNYTITFAVPESYAKGWYELNFLIIEDVLGNRGEYTSWDGSVDAIRVRIV